LIQRNKPKQLNLQQKQGAPVMSPLTLGLEKRWT